MIQGHAGTSKIGGFDDSSPFVVLVLQGVDHGGGDLLHEVVRQPRMQQARVTPHVAGPLGPTLLLRLLVPAANINRICLCHTAICSRPCRTLWL